MLEWDVCPSNHSNSEVAAGNATLFIFCFLFLGWRDILAYLLNMCLCEYFYFESQMNKISTFWNEGFVCFYDAQGFYLGIS